MANTLLSRRDSIETLSEELTWDLIEADPYGEPYLQGQGDYLPEKASIHPTDISSRAAFGDTTTIESVMGSTTGTSGVDLLLNPTNLAEHFESIKQLFSLLIKARGDARNSIYEVLQQTEPTTLLWIAVAEYYERGNEDRLTVAASLLADMGTPALYALRELARSNLPECELFIDVMAHLHGVSLQDRLETLAFLIRNPSVDVRFGLLEALRGFPQHEAVPLLHVLADDKDEELAEEARARLEFMGE